MPINNLPAGDIIVDCLRTIWGIALCVTIPTNIVLYLIFLATNTNTLVDFGWAFMQFLLACLCFALRETTSSYKYQEFIIKFDQARSGYAPIRNVVCLILIGLWASKLGGFILWNRICHKENDPRYEMLAANATGSGGDGAAATAASVKTPSVASIISTSVVPEMSSEAAQHFLRDDRHRQAELRNIINNINRNNSSSALVGGADASAAASAAASSSSSAKESARKKFFFFQFMMQSILVVLPATPIYFIFGFVDQQNPHKQWSFWVGIVVALFGAVNSLISDLQVEGYKREQAIQRANTGITTKGLCPVGWWKKSRHPNLFFEVVNWIGFAILGIDEDANLVSLFGLIGPIFLFLIMKYVTVPATEASMKRSRPNWDELIKDTNMFWPF